MKLTNRLSTIISLVDKDVSVIDVGCDHALIDIYLTMNNNNKCIASDINKNALEIAKQNIKKYNLNIETNLGNGFENIEIKENTTAIIAGMGTSNIIDILDNTNINNLENIIIQSNTNLYELRSFMYSIGYYISNEELIYEKGIFYIIAKYKKGKKNISELELYYGPLISKNKSNVRNSYFEYLIKINETIINNSKDIKLVNKLKKHNEFLMNK